MLILKIICSTLLGLFGLLFITFSIIQIIYTIARDKKNFDFTNKVYLDPPNIALYLLAGILIFAVIILGFI